MAAVDAKRTNQTGMHKNILVTWTLANADTGNGAWVGDLSEVTVQAVGTTTTGTILGSNDGVNFGPLSTPITTLNGTTFAVVAIVNPPAYLSVAALTGTAVITVAGKRYD